MKHFFLSLAIVLCIYACKPPKPPQKKKAPIEIKEVPLSVLVKPDLSANASAIVIVIEKYFNAYLGANLDSLLQTLYPGGPMYPDEKTMDQLRSTATISAMNGIAIVEKFEFVQSSETQAQVKIQLFMKADLSKTGNLTEQRSIVLCDMRKLNGIWKIFEAKTSN